MTERLLLKGGLSPNLVLTLGLLAHLFLFLLVFAMPEGLTRPLFYLLFLVSGGLNGIYVPVAAARLRRAGTTDGVAGSLIVAAAIGAVAMGYVLFLRRERA